MAVRPRPDRGPPTTRGAKCPACGSNGTLEGDDGSECPSITTYDLEDGSPGRGRARLEVPVARFCCETCHLVLEDYELISKPACPTTFEFIDDNPEWPEEEEPEYGND